MTRDAYVLFYRKRETVPPLPRTIEGLSTPSACQAKILDDNKNQDVTPPKEQYDNEANGFDGAPEELVNKHTNLSDIDNKFNKHKLENGYPGNGNVIEESCNYTDMDSIDWLCDA